ncbi:hypothetical protein [Pseudodesulfovibrio sp. zrk46]|uniref:hypothetical protein n=1 Tax=Pseudodesulfovibrio sp. zrk46 TaxID=2725288 RepID=UPI0014498632|nr:hypothetical protein [Pseudodesulfovibrio sp. zrk46]QJB56974.1 hypothetical protein HFN16_11435 [Pseudodesulfovibrio sp. zrk46]
MSEEVKEISFEELELTKPLEKMTTKELRELCIAKLPMITGASGKDKDEIVAAIKELFGIEDEVTVSPYKQQIAELKKQIRALRADKEKVEERVVRDRIRRKINKLKKRTRKLAKTA